MNGRLPKHESSPFHRVHFDPTASGQPSSAIVGALATVTNSDPRTMTPLYDSLDLDALDRLLAHSFTVPAGPAPLSLEFSVDGWDLVVTGGGDLLVYADDAVEPDAGIEFGTD